MSHLKGKRNFALCGLLFLAWPMMMGALGFRDDFDQRILSAHNRERAKLGLPMLRWNQALASGAKQWSDHLSRTGQFAHSPDEPGEELLGENIWGGDPGAFAPESMVGLWIAEKKNFRFATFPHTSVTGNVADVSHYTQVMWRKTSEVGCAISSGRSEDILVCRYKNPGNVIGSEVY